MTTACASSTSALTTYDPATFLAITSTSLNLGVSNVGAANRLPRFGKDGFALIGQAEEKKRN